MTASVRYSPFDDREARFSAGTLGFWFFLAALAILFGSTVLAHWLLLLSIDDDAKLNLPDLPSGLWAGTLVLLISSGSIQWAVMGLRSGDNKRLKRGVIVTAILGFVFLGIQALCWVQWSVPLNEAASATQARYLISSFYVLTGIHAAHIIGGLIPLAIVASRATTDRYTPTYYPGVRYTAMYWHFLDAVWLTLFVTLLFAGK